MPGKTINAKRFSVVMRALARMPSQISAKVAKDIKAQIERDMNAGRDPYGNAWEKKSDGTQSRLLKTGRGRRSILVQPQSGAGIKITVGVLYMIYHQFGGKSHLRGHRKNKNFGRDADRSNGRRHPPQRQYLPFEELPRTWGEIILGRLQEAAQRLIDRG